MNGIRLTRYWAARPPRERWLLGIAAVAVVVALGERAWTAPLGQQLQRARAEGSALQGRLRPAGLPAGPTAGSADESSAAEGARQQERQLRQRLEAAQATVHGLRQQLADTPRLPETLRTLTSTVGAVRLTELSLAGDVEHTAGPAVAAPAASGPAAAPRRLYRLPITLRINGRYEELQHALAQIEQHADHLQWTTLSLDSAQWPSIQLTLKAHVLSLEPRWGASP